MYSVFNHNSRSDRYSPGFCRGSLRGQKPDVRFDQPDFGSAGTGRISCRILTTGQIITARRARFSVARAVVGAPPAAGSVAPPVPVSVRCPRGIRQELPVRLEELPRTVIRPGAASRRAQAPRRPVHVDRADRLESDVWVGRSEVLSVSAQGLVHPHNRRISRRPSERTDWRSA